MSLTLIILLIAVAALVGWLFTQPGEFEVSRSRLINAPTEDLFAKVQDFQAWKEWNPWLPHEPEATLAYSENGTESGGWYSWDGKIIGAGKMIHETITPYSAIHQHLDFTRPMRSKNKVFWRFDPQNEGTLVTWGLQGKMPFLFRWMSGKMDEWVGKDYEIGLAQLATVCGDHSDPLRLEYEGETQCPAESYIFKRYEGSISNIPDAMREGFPELIKVVTDNDLIINGFPFAAYHKFDFKNDMVSCDIAIPLQQAKPVDGYSIGHLPQRNYFRTVSRGSYHHLPLAWYSTYSHLRMAKLKQKKGVPMIERYPADPNEAHGLDLVTWIDLPLRS